MASKESVTQPAIVLWRKKRKNYSIYNFITPKLGIITSSVPHRRLHSLRSSGYLQPFSQVYITVIPEGDFYTLQQVDGQTLAKSLEGNLTNICYAAFVGEFVVTFFNKGESNRALYQLIEAFTIQISKKAIPIAAIILGWQLLSLAGFVPSANEYKEQKGVLEFKDEIYKILGIPISDQLSLALEGVLNYTWHPDSMLAIPKTLWRQLEDMLYAFARIQADKEMESVKFMKAMQISLFN